MRCYGGQRIGTGDSDDAEDGHITIGNEDLVVRCAEVEEMSCLASIHPTTSSMLVKWNHLREGTNADTHLQKRLLLIHALK